MKFCIPARLITYLEGDAAHRQVLVVLQHAEVLSHQGCGVHQTHCRLGEALLAVMLLSHVLKPGQAQIRWRLVALRNPATDVNIEFESQRFIEQSGCKIPILTVWKSRTCVCFEHLHAVCAHAGPKLKAKTQPRSFHGKFKNSRQTAETTSKWEAE